MRTFWIAASVGLTIVFMVLSALPMAAAEPKDEVEAATAAWAQALGEDDPDKVLPLYSSDAVLWGTLSPKLRPIQQHCGIISWEPSRRFQV
jgi:hypothetical protein